MIMHRPLLENLVKVYFGQDFDLFGDSGASIMANYCETATSEEKKLLKEEVALYIKSFSNLEEDFERHYDRDFRPDDFGETAYEFLGAVLKTLE